MNRKTSGRAKSKSVDPLRLHWQDSAPMGSRMEFAAGTDGPVEVTLSRYPGIGTRYTIPRKDAAKLFRELSAYLNPE